MERKEIRLQGLDCANCAKKIEEQVQKMSGVEAVSLNLLTETLIFEMVEGISFEQILQEIKRIVGKLEPDVVVYEKAGTAESVGEENESRVYWRLGIGVLFFALAFFMQLKPEWDFFLYLLSYLIIGGDVLIRALKNIRRGQIFDENFLMGLATIGAFAIQQFTEGVAVMLFYQVGECFQRAAVNHSRKSIVALMKIKPERANLKIGETIQVVSPEMVDVDQEIIIKPGERVPLDGVVISGSSFMDTAALTGESVPRKVEVGEMVLSGFINDQGLLTVKVSKRFEDSAMAKILDLVQNAAVRKAPIENFITKFARYYTPIVVITAALLAVIPPLLFSGASFSDWLYRALVFLVVSCPCALVLSIPLGFFGGIGGAAKSGILVKGGNYLDALNHVDTVVLDKTGTLTKGVFQVTEVKPELGFTREDLLTYAALVEMYSNHPIALSIVKAYGQALQQNKVVNYQELAGYGVKAEIEQKEVFLGNAQLLHREGIAFTEMKRAGTVVYLAVAGVCAGCLVIADALKEDSMAAVKALKQVGVQNVIMLTGDKREVGEAVAAELALNEVYTELLPADKVTKLEEIMQRQKGKVAFVGDGINDAPVLARADIGIAMGGMGRDVAIEAADIVLMTDELSKLVKAFQIAQKTKKIVWQNIVFAMGVKGIVLLLGAGGIATIWEAVFADVGVALLAILNAMRAMNHEKQR